MFKLDHALDKRIEGHNLEACWVTLWRVSQWPRRSFRWPSACAAYVFGSGHVLGHLLQYSTVTSASSPASLRDVSRVQTGRFPAACTATQQELQFPSLICVCSTRGASGSCIRTNHARPWGLVLHKPE